LPISISGFSGSRQKKEHTFFSLQTAFLVLRAEKFSPAALLPAARYARREKGEKVCVGSESMGI
jgi:hypothetical protein